MSPALAGGFLTTAPQGKPKRCIIEDLAVVRKRPNHGPGKKSYYSRGSDRASLVAQWLRIRLPMQGTRVRAMVREDPTCRGATKPVHHNY